MYGRFESLVNPFVESDPVLPERSVWRYLKSQMHPFRRLLPWMVLFGVLKATLECGLIFYAGRLVDLMNQSSLDQFWPTYKYELAAALVVILIVRPIVIWIHHLFLDQAVASNLPEQVRWQAHKQLLGQPLAFFQREMPGRLSNRVMQLGQAVEEMIHSSFEAIWFGLVYIVSAVVLLAQIDWRLGAPLVLWLIAYLFYVRRMAIRISSASRDWSTARSMASGTVVDAYANIETVKLFSSTGGEHEYSADVLQEVRATAQLFRREMTDLSLGMNILNGAMIAGVVGPAIWLWLQSAATVGQVAAAAALTIRLNGMTGWIMWVASRLFENVGVIQDGLITISAPYGFSDNENAVPRKFRRGSVRIQGLHHGHGQGVQCLRGIDLYIPGRQKVGLIGHSGAGKSTLIRLLLRLQVPDRGRILIDGYPVDAMTQSNIREQISVVAQDPSFLHRSVRANLQYGRKNCSEADMILAARIAEAHDLIVGLRDAEGRQGYDAYIGDRGVTLSGGQRQRLAIARAVLKDAQILILDEATSALDTAAEARILANLSNHFANKTVIVITHRLSTLTQLDRIIVLGHGRILEDGSHRELSERDGLYASLWREQTNRQ